MMEENKQEQEHKELTNQKPSSFQETPDSSQKKFVIIAGIIILLFLALVVWATYHLVQPDNSAMTEQIRDVFIIFLALESLIIGIALIILIIQLSTLINLLQNEVRPIIHSTNETVNTLKGTAKFVSDNLAEPVIKINQLLAVIKRLVKPSKM